MILTSKTILELWYRLLIKYFFPKVETSNSTRKGLFIFIGTFKIELQNNEKMKEDLIVKHVELL